MQPSASELATLSPTRRIALIAAILILGLAAWQSLRAMLAAPFGVLAQSYVLAVTSNNPTQQARAESLSGPARSRINTALALDGGNPDWLHLAGALDLIAHFETVADGNPHEAMPGNSTFGRAALAHRPGFPATWLLLAIQEGEVPGDIDTLNAHAEKLFRSGPYSRDTRLPTLRLILSYWYILNDSNQTHAAKLLADSLRTDPGHTRNFLRTNNLALTACGLALAEPAMRPHKETLCKLVKI